ncbi:MAG: L-aspartate oxidase, partial [Cyanothece sp. SIO1E1]|nr:L-aspartate oxidase [Cyanothece sp. SIO1E1]
PEDSEQLHIADTLKAGAGLCDLEAVTLLVKQAPECIQSLVEMGVAFDRHDSELSLTLEAAHSRRRVLHAADTTGRAVVATLTAQVLSCKNIQVISQAFVLDLWLDEQTRACRGVSLAYAGQVTWLGADIVVLATGGGGQVFAQTTNPVSSTGDGVAIAWRAGALLRDLEFIQFHPTALTLPGAPRFLISEAVRGEGAHLIDAAGKRFCFNYHPAGELAPRDVVSRAIFNHLQQTVAHPANANVWLDLRPIPASQIHQRFPNIAQVCQNWGIDVFHQTIPVAPAAHYWMGGIAVDVSNHTSIPGLYAVGETASTGVHGANRLASNSLLECIVFGAQLKALDLPSAPTNIAPEQSAADPTHPASSIMPDQASQDWATQIAKLESWRLKLPILLWQNAGICRAQHPLDEAITQVRAWQQEFLTLPLSQFLTRLQVGQSWQLNWPDAESRLRLWAETRNLLDIAYLILKSAALRTESRGGHYRVDYPQPDPAWQTHTLVQAENWWQSEKIAALTERNSESR